MRLAYGSRIAITSETGLDITYAELECRTNSLANALAATGNGPGDRLRSHILDSAFAALGYQLNRDDHLLHILPRFHIGGGGGGPAPAEGPHARSVGLSPT